jgi:leucyl-tRNA synthetase
LEAFSHLVEETTARRDEPTQNGHLEKWLISRIYAKTGLVSEAIEKLKTRTALSATIYDVWNDLRWYERRSEKPHSETVKRFILAWVRLLAPFSPHLAEELWQIMGQSGFVSASEWPKFDEAEIDERSDELEELVKQTLEDTQEIIATTKITPKKVHYYTAAKWKWRVYAEALDRAESRPNTLDGLIREMIASKSPSPKDLPKFGAKIIKQARTMPLDLRKRKIKMGDLDEQIALVEAQKFLARELKSDVEVHGEEDSGLYDPRMRAKFAEPYRPAIFVE